MNFRVGQKVVCVDAAPRQLAVKELEKGAVYTIIKIYPRALSNGKWRNFPALVLAEAKSLTWRGAFQGDRFRPAVEPEIDISIFTKMLDHSHKFLETV